ncbi:hypothetical protein [Paraliomyxa miuraensis]|uniref:hypothetical protein n=1 Tax=Paraliomyxa miuraensis TaxID=376150 RepID=UPI00225B1DB0|nr:hypothetical protein [Paraliomyxa miuraensis]MCX4245080.1 hypothetical protein [Paraliomyxa miuraensis]
MSTIPPMIQPSPASTVAFVAVVLAVAVMIVLGARAAARGSGESPAAIRRTTVIAAVAVVGWMAVTAAVSGSGVLEHPGLPPRALFFMAGCNLVAVVVTFSRVGTRWVSGLPVAALVGFQAFRLPLELVLHRWYVEGVLPVQMTYAGRNFDIVTGILGLCVGLWLWRRRPSPAITRAAVGLFTLVGFSLLLAVATIAVLSSPVPFRVFTNEPAVLLVFHVPYGWIVPMCVAPALLGHLLALRWLWRAR